MSVKKHRGDYEVSIGQIIVSMIVVTVALTVVFFIGVFIGQNRVINAERKTQELNEAKLISKLKENIGNGSSKVIENLKEQTEEPIKSAKKVQDEQDISQTKQKTDESTFTNQEIKPDKKPLPTVDQNPNIKKPEVIKKTKYTVKVGTFSSYENAKKLFDSLKSSGYEPQLIKESVQGKTICHVIIGNFDSEDSAKQYGNTLREKLPFVNDYMIRAYDSLDQEKTQSKQ